MTCQLNEKIDKGHPGKIDLIVNDEGNKLFGFHFGKHQRVRSDFFHFEMDLMDLIPNEFL